MEELKTKNQTISVFKNMKNPTNFSRSPGASTSDIKGNEAERKVRCQHCGFICDRERDARFPDGSFAGFGISQGAKLSAGTSIGDKRVPAAGTVATSVDTYYARTNVGGCPNCGSYLYDGEKSPKVDTFSPNFHRPID